MQREAVFDFQAQGRSSRIGARTDYWIDLPVAVGVGAIEVLLKHEAVEQDIGAEPRQGPHDIVRTEVLVVDYVDFRQLSLCYRYLNDPVRQLLLRKSYCHRHKTTIAIGHLELREGIPDRLEGRRFAEVFREDRLHVFVTKQSVATNFVALDLEGRRRSIGTSRRFGGRIRGRIGGSPKGAENGKGDEYGCGSAKVAGAVPILLAPLGWSHSQMPFEHGVEQA